MGFARRRCMRWRGFAGRRGLCETWRQGFAGHGCEAVSGAAVRRCRGGVGREAPGGGGVGRGCEVVAALQGARWGGSGAMEYSVRARAPSLHFFTFMGLIFVKYWVIMQM